MHMDTLTTQIDEIKQLPCFVHYQCEIKKVSGGLSQSSFTVFLLKKINSPNEVGEGFKQFFVKSIDLADPASSQEPQLLKYVEPLNISPKLRYRYAKWQVMEFIDAKSLIEHTHLISEKIAFSIPLMATIHQQAIPSFLSAYSIEQLINQQINQACFTATQQACLTATNQTITNFEEVGEAVLCHGDVNFSNVLIDKNDKCRLIDFECSFVGLKEFDIAMFIAVNNLPRKYIKQIVGDYQHHTKLKVNLPLVDAYLACCYLLNGLWYIGHGRSTSQSDLYDELATQQLGKFDQINLIEAKLVSYLFE